MHPGVRPVRPPGPPSPGEFGGSSRQARAGRRPPEHQIPGQQHVRDRRAAASPRSRRSTGRCRAGATRSAVSSAVPRVASTTSVPSAMAAAAVADRLRLGAAVRRWRPGRVRRSRAGDGNRWVSSAVRLGKPSIGSDRQSGGGGLRAGHRHLLPEHRPDQHLRAVDRSGHPQARGRGHRAARRRVGRRARRRWRPDRLSDPGAAGSVDRGARDPPGRRAGSPRARGWIALRRAAVRAIVPVAAWRSGALRK